MDKNNHIEPGKPLKEYLNWELCKQELINNINALENKTIREAFKSQYGSTPCSMQVIANLKFTSPGNILNKWKYFIKHHNECDWEQFVLEQLHAPLRVNRNVQTEAATLLEIAEQVVNGWRALIPEFSVDKLNTNMALKLSVNPELLEYIYKVLQK